MKRIGINSALMMAFLLSSYASVAQLSEIKGQVTTFKAYAVKGAMIKAKKSKEEVLTDSLGYFTINVKKGDMLRIKAKGFEALSLPAKDEDISANLIYMDNEWGYGQVIENGYLTKSDLDYALANMKDENNNFDQFQDIWAVIQSVYPPAKVDASNGRQTVFLNSRGGASVGADSGALLVVDGIVTADISGLHPSKVAQVKVLIGTDTSLYGSRGANGVVEITLKN
ncbi:MAG: TonB-dependent receptor plug domain-containing protein [Cyclobacteriaceae bacterium]